MIASHAPRLAEAGMGPQADAIAFLRNALGPFLQRAASTGTLDLQVFDLLLALSSIWGLHTGNIGKG